ncbi:MAG TPA: hypothetical protein VGO58_01665 [Chitinophagaceae bacterium]|jgi:hypothetical protein|nr:hypothetical protein [Chitinophagaceae bacterium]
MKHLLLILSMTLFAAGAMSQANISLNKAKEIPRASIQAKIKNNKTVQYVDPKALVQGQNFMRLRTGDLLYIEYKNRKIVSFTLTNARGVQQGKPIVMIPSVQFQCSQKFCVCSGDADCNDMFTTNVCGPDAACFGNSCVCYR